MSKLNISPVNFNPSAATVDLSNIDNFSINNLMAILNSTARTAIYDPVSAGRGYANVAGSVVTLQYNTSLMSATDTLIAIYDFPDRGTGIDYSMNAPLLPNVGADFNSNPPYANYTLIRAVPRNMSRSLISVQNTSGSRIVILRDDGTAGTGSIPINASMIALEPTGSMGAGGAIWSSNTFKGRIQVYGPNSALFVSIFED